MLRTCSFRLIAMLFMVAASFNGAFAANNSTTTNAWKSDLVAWRAEHAKKLQQPNGWLTLIGLEWLKPGQNTFGAARSNAIIVHAPVAPMLGAVKLEGEAVQLLPPANGYPQGLLVDGKPPANPQKLVSDNPGTPTKITSGSVTIIVIHRGDRYALRIKDSKSPDRVHFHGLKWYAPNEAYRLQAKWVPYNPPHQVPVPTVLGTEVMSEVPGAAEFALNGKTYRLEPILEQPDDKELMFIFRDTTSKTETYGAGRFLYTELPNHGLSQPGELTVDFNYAENPPCAYTPYATCPLPVPGNRLPIPIPAGQQRYHE